MIRTLAFGKHPGSARLRARRAVPRAEKRQGKRSLLVTVQAQRPRCRDEREPPGFRCRRGAP